MSTENLDIKLIPWDPLSLAQFQRLRQQRLACGWGADRVELWQHQQLLNQKALYWIARFLPPAVKDQTSHKFQTLKPDPRSTQQQLIQAHTHRFPLEQDPLSDTAPTTTSPQRCRSKPFTPIGHVSLDLIPNTISPSIDPAKHRFGGSNFYISPALRGQFLARMAMEAMKQLAASAPYSARELVAEVPSRGTDAKVCSIFTPCGILRRFESDDVGNCSFRCRIGMKCLGGSGWRVVRDI